MTDVLHSNLETDLRMADLLDGAVLTTLSDFATIRNVPGAVMYLGDQNGKGSDTARIPFASLDGGDAFAATGAENSSLSTTALTDTSATIAVVRHGLRRDISDLAEATARGEGDITAMRLAQSMVGEAEAGWMEGLSDVIDNFTSTAGSTGVNLDVDDLYDAISTLELANVNGPYFGMLHPQQVVDLQTALRAEGGVLQWQAATAEMIRMKGQGYIGEFLGIQFFKSSRVNLFNSSADRAGAIWGAGAIGWKSATPRIVGNITTTPNPILTVEFDRTSYEATNHVVGHSYWGISILQDALGVAVITDA